MELSFGLELQFLERNSEQDLIAWSLEERVLGEQALASCIFAEEFCGETTIFSQHDHCINAFDTPAIRGEGFKFSMGHSLKWTPFGLG